MYMNRVVPISILVSIALIFSTGIATATSGLKVITLSPDPQELFRSPVIDDGHDHNREATRDRDLCDGFPVDLASPGAGFPYTPTLYDADNDGADEIFLRGGHAFALNGDGTFLPGWPTAEMAYMGYGTTGSMPGPSVADMTNDGDNEVFWAVRDWWAGSSHLWCFNARELDGTDLPGYPQYAPDDYSNALAVPFVLGDTDSNGELEAWTAHTLGNTGTYNRVSALDHLGNLLFTTDLESTESVLSMYYGDLDGDLEREMFAVSWNSPIFWLHAFESDGSESVGYPVVLETLTEGYLMMGAPIPLDINGDGDLEILLGYNVNGSSIVNCKDSFGFTYPGFPLTIATSSQLFYLGLGDVTGDQYPELIAFDNHLGGDYRAFVIDMVSGEMLPGWPYDLSDWPKSFPTVVDVDDDALQDICFATDGGELYAISGEGVLLPDYPLSMPAPSISGVSAGDIDGDGLFELVAATWDGEIYAWNTTGQALPERADWPMRGINARNTGIYGDPGEPESVNDPVAYQPGQLSISPNPVLHSAEFQFDVGYGTAIIRVFDISGRLIDEFSSNGSGQVSWLPPSFLPSGVYYAQVSGAVGATARKFIILR